MEVFHILSFGLSRSACRAAKDAGGFDSGKERSFERTVLAEQGIIHCIG